jgi:transposase
VATGAGSALGPGLTWDLRSWLGGFGDLALAGVEGTGSYGAGLARYLAAAGIRVVEAVRADRQDRRRQGTSDPLDASAGRGPRRPAEQPGRPGPGRRGRGDPGADGGQAQRPQRADPGQRQARSLIIPGPDDLRARLARHFAAALAEGDRGAAAPPGRRRRVRGLLSLYGVGPDTAALLLVAAGDHPGRLRSEDAWAHLCGAVPIPASSGKIRRHRLDRGGNREASHALWRIVITRMSAHPGGSREWRSPCSALIRLGLLICR